MLAPPLVTILFLSHVATPIDLGEYALAYALSAPLYALFGIHARAFIATDQLGDFDVHDVIAHRLPMAGAIFVVLVVVRELGGANGAPILVLLAISLQRGGDALAEVSAGVLQRRRRARAIAQVYWVRCLFCLPALVAIYIATRSLAGALAASSLVSAALFVAYDRKLTSAGGTEIVLTDVARSLCSKRPAKLTAKLIGGGVLNAVAAFESNVARYMAESLYGVAAVGLYTASSAVLSIFSNIVHPIFFMTLAPLADMFAEGNHRSIAVARRIVIINFATAAIFGIALVAMTVFTHGGWLRLMLGDKIRADSTLLLALSVVTALQLCRSCLGFALTALRVINLQTATSVTSIIVTATLAFALAPFGLPAVAASQALACSLGLTITSAIAIRRLVEPVKQIPSYCA